MAAPVAPPRGVLFLHPSDEQYGADRVLLSMARATRESGWRVNVLLSDDVPPGWLSAELSRLGIPNERGPLAPARRRYFSLGGLATYLRRLGAARSYVRGAAARFGADIIHVNTSSLLVGAVLGRPRGARVVWHVHEIVLRPRPLALLFRIVPVLGADVVLAVSDATRRHLGLFGIGRGKVLTLHNGIPPETPSEPDPVVRDMGSPLVAYVGRLNRWKGYEVYVDAISQVAPLFPTAAFVLAGDPPLGEEWRVADLVDRVDSAHLAGRLQLLGFLEDSAALFAAADIVAVPSVWPDPLPTVVLEAMRAGCVVIASNHGGAPEMIENGRSGFLVPPGDANALASAVATALRDDALRHRIGAAARERVASDFSAARFAAELQATYEKLVP